jgi:hypothetical protein
MNAEKYAKSKFKSEIKAAVKTVESLRTNKDNPQDAALADYFKLKGVKMSEVYEDLGIDPSVDTISNMFTMVDEDVRWLVPEIIRDALRLGMRRSPIYPAVVAATQSISGTSVTVPHINMSEATPRYVGQAETITQGNISFGEKTLKTRKMGRGIAIPYEVAQYVSLDVIGIFLQDFGVKLGHGLDTLLVSTLLNGEQANGSESAPVIGVATANTLTYKDMLRIWVRMSRMGKNPSVMLAGEDLCIDILDMDEFKKRESGTPQANITFKTPIPSRSDLYVHGTIPDDQVIIMDTASTVIKYDSQPLLVESEKIVSNQTEATYASLTTGFAIVYRDSRVVLDKSLAFASNGFPSYMDVDALEAVTIE